MNHVSRKLEAIRASELNKFHAIFSAKPENSLGSTKEHSDLLEAPFSTTEIAFAAPKCPTLPSKVMTLSKLKIRDGYYSELRWADPSETRIRHEYFRGSKRTSRYRLRPIQKFNCETKNIYQLVNSVTTMTIQSKSNSNIKEIYAWKEQIVAARHFSPELFR